MDPVEPLVHDAVEASRFEATMGEDLTGILTYRLGSGWIALLHTEVLPDHEGRGVGSRLASAAMADARARSLRVIVRCPFVASWLTRHPEHDDLIMGTVGSARPAAPATDAAM